MDKPGAMRVWIDRRAGLWLSAGERLQTIRKSSAVSAADALALIQDYRQVARDWSMARQAGATAATRAHLGSLYGQLHHELYRRPPAAGSHLLRLVRDEVPAAIREMRRQILWVAAWFLVTAGVGWLLVHTYPELMSLVASETMIDSVEHGELWTNDILNVVPSSIMAVGIFTNNITVSLLACCIGVFYGLGTLYLIGVNGMMVGAAFAFTARYGMADKLFEFVIAHGIVELSMICVAGGVGVSLGEALIRPGQLSRRDAFERAAQQAAKIMLVGIVFLVGAGIIEGFVSPDPMFPLISRIVIGVGYAILFFTVISGAIRPARSADSASARRKLA